MNYKKRVFEIIETAKPGDKTSRIFDLSLVALIVTNIVAVILSTVGSVQERFADFLWWFELVSVILFSVEYLLRVWTSLLKKQYKSPILGRIKYMFSPMAMIDLLAILPFYLPMLIPVDLRFLRALRLFRLLRLLKMGRYSNAMQVVGSILKRKRPELTITFVIVFVLLIISASLMYYVENAAQPGDFGSIPETLWWSVCTLTTVGYGDVTPVTPLGKVCAGFIALLGIGMFALPAGILASGFEEEMKKKTPHLLNCPHCGEEVIYMNERLSGAQRRIWEGEGLKGEFLLPKGDEHAQVVICRGGTCNTERRMRQ